LRIEGSWEEVMTVVGKAHALLHNNGVVRVQTDIRIGTRYRHLQMKMVSFLLHVMSIAYENKLHLYRTDKVQSMEDKVSVVEKILNEDGNVTEQAKDHAEPEASSKPFEKKIIRC